LYWGGTVTQTYVFGDAGCWRDARVNWGFGLPLPAARRHPAESSSRFSKYSGSASDKPTTRFETSTSHQPWIFLSRASRRDHDRKITEERIKSAAKKLEMRVAKISSTNRRKFGP